MRSTFLRSVVVAAGLAVLTAANAQVPATVSYQGRLTDNVGTPLTGTYSLSFAILTSAIGGTQLWAESHGSVAVTQGDFSVVLGSVTPLPASVFAGPDRWLSIVVNGTQTITPRTKFASTPYAQRVGTLDGATAGSVTGNLTIGGNLQVVGQLNPGTGIVAPGGITIQSTGSNVLIVAGSSQITVSPDGTVSISCVTASINASNELNLSAGSRLSMTAPYVSVAAQDSARIDSDFKVTIDAANKTTIRGSTVETTATGTVDVNGSLITLN